MRTRIDLAGNTAEATRVDLAIGDGRLRSELLPNGGVAIEAGSCAPPMTRNAGSCASTGCCSISAAAASWRSPAPSPRITPELIAAAAAAQPPAAHSTANLTAALKHVPAARLRDLWPASFSPGGRRWVLANVHDGVLDEASVQLAIDSRPGGAHGRCGEGRRNAAVS